MRYTIFAIQVAVLTALAGCATPSSQSSVTAESATTSKELPEALRRAAYDAPDYGDTLPPSMSMAPTATASSDVVTVAKAEDAYVPRVIRAQAAPVALESAIAPTQRAETDRPTYVPAPYKAPVVEVPSPKSVPVRTASAADIVAQNIELKQAPPPQTSTPKASYQVAQQTVTPPPTRLSAPAPTPSSDDSRGPATHSVMANATPTPPQRTRVAPKGTFGLHLASYRDHNNVSVGWETLRQDHPDLFSGLQARGAKVDIPEKGEFIRLIVGPFSSPADAKRLCSELKSLDEYCMVMPFSGAPVQ